MGLFSNPPGSGLDLGEQSSKFVEIKKSGSSFKVTGLALCPRSGRLGVENRPVVLAVPVENIITRQLTMPVMPDSELAAAVRFEAEAQMPVPAKDLTIDFAKCGYVVEDGVKKQLILVAAVRTDTVEGIAQRAEMAGFTARVLDIEPLAIKRAIQVLNGEMIPRGGDLAIINMGAGSASISVFAGDCLAFTRALHLGGEKFTAQLAAEKNIPGPEAEKAKKEIDLAGPPEQCQPLLPLVEELATEIRRSIDYYLAQNRGQKISGIIITGGAAQLLGLPAYLSGALDCEVQLFNPVSYLQLTGKTKDMAREIQAAGSALTLAVGLALSEVE